MVRRPGNFCGSVSNLCDTVAFVVHKPGNFCGTVGQEEHCFFSAPTLLD